MTVSQIGAPEIERVLKEKEHKLHSVLVKISKSSHGNVKDVASAFLSFACNDSPA